VEHDALRLRVLLALQGPTYVTEHEIPGDWPLQRSGLAGAIRALWREGLLERRADPRAGGATPAWRATAAGKQAMAALHERNEGVPLMAR
jgi:hypothetical protein